MDNNYWDKQDNDNEDVVENNDETLHEHEDGTIHSHEGGDVEHSHEEEEVGVDYDVAVYGPDKNLIKAVEEQLSNLGTSYKVLSSIDDFEAGPWFILCGDDWEAFVLASKLNENGSWKSTLQFSTEPFASSNVPYATGRIVVPYDEEDDDLDLDAMVKDGVYALLELN
tara:strand:- start:1956 stop:2459 length:504 start_codon:yes stop_codon:yes gene_type:complete